MFTEDDLRLKVSLFIVISLLYLELARKRNWIHSESET